MSAPSHQPPAHWTPEFSQQILDEFRQSGLSASAFARRRGFSAQRVAWLRQQTEQGTDAAPPRVVELVPVGAAAEPLGPQGHLRICCPSGHTVEVVGADLLAMLTTTLRVLQGGAC